MCVCVCVCSLKVESTRECVVWSYKGVVGNVCVNLHSHLTSGVCFCLFFGCSQRGLRARRQVRERGRERERVNHAEREKKVRERDERSEEEGCFILYCEGLLLINVSWSVSVGAE